ncbi:MFS transporter [Paenibacillus sp. Marseille-Q4541]|uniref:MFS transporter n=1 Tax=Paenibacillus sp. Marseille-Q4541 TaxID=2831522 RepID=UPI001BAC8226|nr:MFS transporter [Paenibacillus sp. Marseille-Q4541]
MNTELASITENYSTSLQKQKKLYERTLLIVCISQIFGGAGLAAGITVGALLAQQMLGTDAYAGVPAALFTLGSAAAAFLVGRISAKHGRRMGLTTGYLIGGFGAAGTVAAAMTNQIWLLFVSLLLYGFGTATNLQARYAGTDLANPSQRGTAISIAMVSTTFGAVAGPNLVGVMGDFALSLGIPELAGPFILAGTAFLLAALINFSLLRPDPLLIAKAMYSQQKKTEDQHLLHSVNIERNRRGIQIGSAIMILTQIVMVAIMTMTPVHMLHHGHTIAQVGLVIGIHVGCMYLPSLFTGILIDKLGRFPMAIAAGVVLLTAGLTAAMAPSDSLIMLIVALGLLGLGWNLGLISGTTLIIDSTHITTRAKIQGSVDVFIALSGALGGALSGMVVAGSSYMVLSLAGGLISLLLIPIVLRSK